MEINHLSTVSSLELSKELHNVSGWEDTFTFWTRGDMRQADKESENWDSPIAVSIDVAEHASAEAGGGLDEGRICPAYEVGYLLRRLPTGVHISKTAQGYAVSMSEVFDGSTVLAMKVETPEDTLTRLAIELFKQGILKRQGDA